MKRRRRSSGAAFMPAVSEDAAHFRITSGAEFLSGYESSPKYERSFCSRCGSQLFGRHAAHPTFWVRLGGLDDDPGTRRAVQIMTGSRASWYSVVDCPEQFPDVPPFHYFFPGPSGEDT